MRNRWIWLRVGRDAARIMVRVGVNWLAIGARFLRERRGDKRENGNGNGREKRQAREGLWEEIVRVGEAGRERLWKRGGE
eukprot:1023619-Amorphochlora_amoeboformis.AAC.1